MLHEFLTLNHDEVINRCRNIPGRRVTPNTGVELGVPVFLSLLVDVLRIEQETPNRGDKESDHTLSGKKIRRTAALHGAQLLRSEYSIDQVVHVYGDVCQVVTGLAIEQKTPITTDELRTLDRCLDDAIAGAVTAFAFGPNERRRLIDVAIHSFAAIQTGALGLHGATTTAHVAALAELDELLRLDERRE